jgi:hypothetical protein
MLSRGKSKRRYAVVGEHDMPTSLYDIFDHDLHAVVSGKFEVCPYRGKDRFGNSNVCIESASSIVSAQRRGAMNN